MMDAIPVMKQCKLIQGDKIKQREKGPDLGQIGLFLLTSMGFAPGPEWKGS